MKIYIDNEEVLCDKEITIKEELLNTSSTILKNCYPKSWETTKDYTQWYFPKDYALCKIYQVGNNDFTLEGKSEQGETPTPTQPETITNLTGDITVNVDDKEYPLSLGNIELCSTQNYKDIIFKNTIDSPYYKSNLKLNTWYIQKNIEKLVLDGSETWDIQNYDSTKYQFKNINACNFINQSDIFLCNRFVDYGTYDIDWASTQIGLTKLTSGSSKLIFFTIQSSLANSISSWKTWLSNNNVELYYSARNVNYIEITDSILINQLEMIISELIFCGVAKNTGNVSLNPREPHYVDLQILDFKTFLSEGETLDYVITNQTVTQAISTVVNSISDYGFIVGNVEIIDDTTIGAYSTLDKTPYDVFQYFANITGTRWFTRMIDDTTVAIDFYDPSMLNQGMNIEYTKEFFETNDIIDMKFNYSTRDYRNKQVIKSNQVLGGVNYTENFIADGASDTYILSANVGKIISIFMGSSQLTYTTKENRELGYIADVYYSFGQNSLVTDNVFLQGAVIKVIYTPLVEGRQIVYNANEVNRIENSIGRKGVVARYETRNDTIDSNELYLIGKSYIRYKGTSEITLTVKTRQNHWNIGDIVYFDAPINDLDKEYMVKGKTIQRLPLNNVIFYTFELTSSFNDEKAINYFDNQRAKNSGNISEGQFIKRNIDIPNEVIIVFDNLQIEEGV